MALTRSRVTPAQPLSPEVALETLEGLAACLEELRVAEEELRIQNEEIVGSRASLELAHKRYRELFEFAPGGYLVTDTAGTIEDANWVAATLFDRSPAHLSGKPVTVFFADGELQDLRRHIGDVSVGRSGRVFESQIRLPDGARPVTITVEPVTPVAGEPRRLRWMIVDISPLAATRERARAEGQRALAWAEAEIEELKARNALLEQRLRQQSEGRQRRGGCELGSPGEAPA